MRHYLAAIGAFALLIQAASIAGPVAPTLVLAPKAKVETPAALPGPAGGRALTATDVENWLDGFLPYALQRGDVAGAVVVIVKDGQLLFQKGYGYADYEKRIAVDPQRTLFRTGSVSKLFTWTAVMQQVEQGKIDLDADVNTYLDFKIPPRQDGAITMRHLMTHTPGFEEVIKGLLTSDPAKAGNEKVLKSWIPTRVYKVGTTPAYSNYGAALAGYIVERVSGEKFDDYLDRHIFRPLGMQRSTLRQPLPKPWEPDMAKGYRAASEGPQYFEILPLSPSGSQSATGADMSAFMIAHLQDGAYGRTRILKPETARTMHDTAYTLLPPLNRSLLGFYENNINGRRVVSHSGDTQFFHAALDLFKDDGVGVFMAVNSTGKDGSAYPIRQALFEQFADRYLPGTAKDGQVDAKIAAEHADMIAGTYDVSRRSHTNFVSILGFVGQVTVLSDGKGGITVPSMTGFADAPKKWREIAPFVWREVGGKGRLAAKLEGGKIVRFSSDDLASSTVYDRAPWWRDSAWLTPVLLAALAALGLTGLQWPVSALARRRYGASLPLTGQPLRAYRAVRIAAIGAVATIIGWVLIFTSMMADLDLASGLGPFILLLGAMGILAFGGGLVLALWNLWLTWTGKRPWPSKLWSFILVLSFLALLWLAFVCKLISFAMDF